MGKRVPSKDVPDCVDPLLTYREAAAVLTISTATFSRRVADGTVPPPVKIGSTSRWPLSEIVAVVEAAKAARPTSRLTAPTGAETNTHRGE
jgi:predicted DNA-binding transcriptional regulator AlpA